MNLPFTFDQRVVHTKTQGRIRGIVEWFEVTKERILVHVRVDRLQRRMPYDAANLMAEDEWERTAKATATKGERT